MNNKDAIYNYNQDIEQPLSQIKNIRATKTKFLRDLNYKLNTIHKSGEKNGKNVTNSRAKEQHLAKNSRNRYQHSMQEMDSLLERAIPGAKILKGQWKDHKLNGDVVIQYDNGSTFQGKFQNGMKIQGKMTYNQANCEYEGGFFGQKFSGYGKLTYFGGRSIQGQWDNMEFIGKATITYPNGDVYYGPVDENLYKHGQGYIFLNNGYKYIGMFKNGSITGVGSYYKDEKLIMKGVWQKGKLVKEFTPDELETGDSIFQAELTLTQTNKQNSKKLRSSDQSLQSFDSPSEKSSILLLKTNQKYFIGELTD